MTHSGARVNRRGCIAARTAPGPGLRAAGARARLAGWCGAAAVAGAMGCGGPPQAAAPEPGRDPARTVEAFLDAAARRDHAAMAGLFGTGTGPIGEQGGGVGCAVRRLGSWLGLGERCLAAAEIALRMDLMARILAHASYRMGTAVEVVGHGRPASRVEVALDVGGGRVVAVPFVVIRADNGRWLVTEVELERLTG